MKIDVRFEGKAEKMSLDGRVVVNAVEKVLAAYPEIKKPALSVLITGDDEIRVLNNAYMGYDKPTDVLSFPAGDSPVVEGEENYLGDMMISLETAARQASQGGHTLEQEIELLTVHGLLHLLGFDHGDAAEKMQMWALQSDFLKALANPLTPP